MKMRSVVLALTMGLLAGALASCGKSPTGPGNLQSTDQSQTTATLTAAAPLVVDNISDTEPQTSYSVTRPGTLGVEAAIHPVFFWRHITSSTRTFAFAFSDTDSTGHPRQALVTINHRWLGTFNVVHTLAADSTHPDTMNVVHKALDDRGTRQVLLKRVRSDDSTHIEWRIAAISALKITSVGATTQIVSLRIQATGLDITITDPTAFFYLRQILRFAPSDSVHLTATTLRNDDVVVLHRFDLRQRFHNNGDNTYSFTMVVGSTSGWRYFGVDAISHGSLFDDTLAYDSQRWHFPFVITSDAAVDYYP